MFENKKITKEKVKKILYAIQNEFYNESEFFEYENREISDDDIYMLDYYLNCFVNKLELVIDDELVD